MQKLKAEWWIYLKTLSWMGPLCLLIYFYTNWRTDQVMRAFDVYFDFELSLPFFAPAAYVYCLMPLLMLFPPLLLDEKNIRIFLRQLFIGYLVSLAFFYIFPAPLAFIRPEATNEVLALIYKIDRPNNASFSLFQFHLALISMTCLGELDTYKRTCMIGMAGLLALSGPLIWQQHALGIMTAWVTAVVLRLSIREIEDQV